MRTQHFLIAALVALSLTSCDRPTEPASDEPGPSVPPGPSLTITSPQDGDEVQPPLRLEMDVTGIQIVPANGDSSGRTGHYHVFIDRDPVAAGQRIPMEPSVVHTTNNPVELKDVPPGRHKLTVVLGDGNHVRIGDVEATIDVTVRGQS